MRHALRAHLSVAAALLLAVASDAAPSRSQPTVELCHPLRDGSGDPVRDIRGNEVLTTASAPCPTARQQAVAAALAARLPGTTEPFPSRRQVQRLLDQAWRVEPVRVAVGDPTGTW